MIPLPFTAKQKLDAIKHELGFRRTAYQRRVVDGKMTTAAKEREISIFEAIQRDYEQAAASERNASDLFAANTVIEHDPFVSLGDAAASVVSNARRKLEAEAARLGSLTTDVDGMIRRLREIETDMKTPHEIKDAAQ